MSEVKETPQQEMSRKRREQLNEEIKKAGMEFHRTLVDVEPRGKLPEPLFVKEFLPFFSGKPVKDKNSIMRDWMIIAGSPTAEVEILDINRNVVYRVPSLFDTNVVSMADGMSLRRILLTANEKSKGLPMVADNYLLSTIGGDSGVVVNKEAAFNVETRTRWTEIFQRYDGLALTNKEVKELTAPKSNPDDELETSLPNR